MLDVQITMNGLQEALAGFTRVSAYLGRQRSDVIGRRLAREGLRIVKNLTPVQQSTNRLPSSKRGHPPFRDQWGIIERNARTSSYEAIIRNKATKGGPSANGFKALASVEFGARPHVIRARAGKFMIWRPSQQLFVTRDSDMTKPPSQRGLNQIVDIFNSRGNERIARARHVNHPGHKGFRMVQETRVVLNDMADRMLFTYAKQIARTFGQGFNITVS